METRRQERLRLQLEAEQARSAENLNADNQTEPDPAVAALGSPRLSPVPNPGQDPGSLAPQRIDRMSHSPSVSTDRGSMPDPRNIEGHDLLTTPAQFDQAGDDDLLSPDPLPPYAIGLRQYQDYRSRCHWTHPNREEDDAFKATCLMTYDQYTSARMEGRVVFATFLHMIEHPASILTQEGWWNINDAASEMMEVYDSLDEVLMRPEGTPLMFGQYASRNDPGRMVTVKEYIEYLEEEQYLDDQLLAQMDGVDTPMRRPSALPFDAILPSRSQSSPPAIRQNRDGQTESNSDADQHGDNPDTSRSSPEERDRPDPANRPPAAPPGTLAADPVDVEPQYEPVFEPVHGPSGMVGVRIVTHSRTGSTDSTPAQTNQSGRIPEWSRTDSITLPRVQAEPRPLPARASTPADSAHQLRAALSPSRRSTIPASPTQYGPQDLGRLQDPPPEYRPPSMVRSQENLSRAPEYLSLARTASMTQLNARALRERLAPLTGRISPQSDSPSLPRTGSYQQLVQVVRSTPASRHSSRHSSISIAQPGTSQASTSAVPLQRQISRAAQALPPVPVDAAVAFRSEVGQVTDELNRFAARTDERQYTPQAQAQSVADTVTNRVDTQSTNLARHVTQQTNEIVKQVDTCTGVLTEAVLQQVDNVNQHITLAAENAATLCDQNNKLGERVYKCADDLSDQIYNQANQIMRGVNERTDELVNDLDIQCQQLRDSMEEQKRHFNTMFQCTHQDLKLAMHDKTVSQQRELELAKEEIIQGINDHQQKLQQELHDRTAAMAIRAQGSAEQLASQMQTFMSLQKSQLEIQKQVADALTRLQPAKRSRSPSPARAKAEVVYNGSSPEQLTSSQSPAIVMDLSARTMSPIPEQDNPAVEDNPDSAPDSPEEDLAAIRTRITSIAALIDYYTKNRQFDSANKLLPELKELEARLPSAPTFSSLPTDTIPPDASESDTSPDKKAFVVSTPKVERTELPALSDDCPHRPTDYLPSCSYPTPIPKSGSLPAAPKSAPESVTSTHYAAGSIHGAPSVNNLKGNTPSTSSFQQPNTSRLGPSTDFVPPIPDLTDPNEVKKEIDRHIAMMLRGGTKIDALTQRIEQSPDEDERRRLNQVLTKTQGEYNRAKDILEQLRIHASNLVSIQAPLPPLSTKIPDSLPTCSPPDFDDRDDDSDSTTASTITRYRRSKKRPKESRLPLSFNKEEFLHPPTWDYLLEYLDTGIPGRPNLTKDPILPKFYHGNIPEFDNTDKHPPEPCILYFRRMLVEYGYKGTTLADYIKGKFPKAFRARLRSMKPTDQDTPSMLCRFMMKAYTTEYTGRKFVHQFKNFHMTKEHTYGTFLDDLMVEFDQAEPELSERFGPKAVEMIIVQYHNGMLPGHNNSMREYFTKRFIDELDNVQTWNRDQLVDRIKLAMSSRDGLRQSLKPLAAVAPKAPTLGTPAMQVHEELKASDKEDDTPFYDMENWIECDQWNPTAVCVVHPDDECRNCGKKGHWAFQCEEPPRNVKGRFFQRRYAPRNQKQQRPFKRNRDAQQQGGQSTLPPPAAPQPGQLYAPMGPAQNVQYTTAPTAEPITEENRSNDLLEQLLKLVKDHSRGSSSGNESKNSHRPCKN